MEPNKEAFRAETIKFIGDLTIDNSQELHQQLLTAINRSENFTIAFADVTAVDLAFLQLLCSAHRSAVRGGIIMKLDPARPEVLTRAVQEVGFLRDEGCALDSQGTCIWKDGWT